jgi:hypothetical protein
MEIQSAGMNQLWLIGNLTGDPVSGQSAHGLPTADYGIQVVDRYENRSGETVETCLDVNILAFGRAPSICYSDANN